jgi:SAM-dependent methyltransferase
LVAQKDWYETYFDENYLKIYMNRNEEASHKELESLMAWVQWEPGQRVLDLCCGFGRHSRWLAGKGLRVTGVDLSTTLLQEAIRRTIDLDIQYMHADARKIPFDEEMDLVVSMFTSFGYFTEDQENEEVISRVSHALKPGGFFLFDYLNPGFLRLHLNPYSSSTQGEIKIDQYRSIQEPYVCKKIKIHENDKEQQYEERIKLYDLDSMTEMLKKNDLQISYLFGDYDASNYDPSESPRMIFICRKNKVNGV